MHFYASVNIFLMRILYHYSKESSMGSDRVRMCIRPSLVATPSWLVCIGFGLDQIALCSHVCIIVD